MPKMKTRKSAAKRFKKTGSGKIKHNKTGARHFMSRKKPTRKRKLRKTSTLAGGIHKRTKKMIIK